LHAPASNDEGNNDCSDGYRRAYDGDLAQVAKRTDTSLRLGRQYTPETIPTLGD
jgi:hypothetical protein